MLGVNIGGALPSLVNAGSSVARRLPLGNFLVRLSGVLMLLPWVPLLGSAALAVIAGVAWGDFNWAVLATFMLAAWVLLANCAPLAMCCATSYSICIAAVLTRSPFAPSPSLNSSQRKPIISLLSGSILLLSVTGSLQPNWMYTSA